MEITKDDCEAAMNLLSFALYHEGDASHPPAPPAATEEGAAADGEEEEGEEEDGDGENDASKGE